MQDLMIYDDIGDNGFGGGVTAAGVMAQLNELDGDISIHINSLGGDVFEGHAIYNLIRSYDKGEKTVVIDGIAASAASVIAMAGDKIEMPINAMLMIHDPWTVALGNSTEMLKTAEILEQIKGTIVDVYASRVEMDKEVISNMMTAETWLNADEAAEFGFAAKSDKRVVLNNIERKQWINKVPEVSEVPPTPRPNFEARKRYLEILAEAT